MEADVKRLLVVSYSARRPFAPRGVRTRAVLAAATDAGWTVELVAAPASAPGDSCAVPSFGLLRSIRRLLGGVQKFALVDKQEPWAWARLARLRPSAEAAYLVGAPFSPPALAARALARSGIPYVVDVGDPWILTAGRWTASRHVRGLALVRARRLEAAMWHSAAGAIVTSKRQADALRDAFPGLACLVRPNGYEPVEDWSSPKRAERSDGVLRLAHFGNLYDVRVDVRGFLKRAVASGIWGSVELDQYGNVWDPAARRALDAPGLHVRELPMRPPRDLPALASAYDAVLAIGNRSGLGPPSKVFQYATLPVPRVALVGDPATDETAAYVRDRPGWAVLAVDDPETPRRLRDYLDRAWQPIELSPVGDAWPAVARQIVAFVEMASVSHGRRQ